MLFKTTLHKTKNAGVSIIEVVIGTTIITVGLLALANAFNLYVKYALTHDKKVQATYLLEEGIEAVSLLRDESWATHIATLTPATTYYLYFNGTDWRLGSTPEYIDSVMLRSVEINDVLRETNSQIASTGTSDSNTKKVTVTVTYPQAAETVTMSLSKYITNMYNN